VNGPEIAATVSTLFLLAVVMWFTDRQCGHPAPRHAAPALTVLRGRRAEIRDAGVLAWLERLRPAERTMPSAAQARVLGAVLGAVREQARTDTGPLSRQSTWTPRASAPAIRWPSAPLGSAADSGVLPALTAFYLNAPIEEVRRKAVAEVRAAAAGMGQEASDG
jgi:hypothetical protein